MKQIYRDLRSTMIVAFIAFIVCWLSNIWIFPDGRHHVDPDKWLKTQLGLTEEQIKKIEGVEKDYATRRTRLLEETHVANQELAKALMEEKEYSERVRAASLRVDKLQAELKEATLQHFFLMQPAMTPEQIKKMNALAAHALSQPQY